MTKHTPSEAALRYLLGHVGRAARLFRVPPQDRPDLLQDAAVAFLERRRLGAVSPRSVRRAALGLARAHLCRRNHEHTPPKPRAPEPPPSAECAILARLTLVDAMPYLPVTERVTLAIRLSIDPEPWLAQLARERGLDPAVLRARVNTALRAPHSARLGAAVHCAGYPTAEEVREHQARVRARVGGGAGGVRGVVRRIDVDVVAPGKGGVESC